jgi:putative acetyltransferase
MIEHVPAPTEDARVLIGELDAELNAAYVPERRHGLSIARVFRPSFLFFIASLDGQPFRCGGQTLKVAHLDSQMSYRLSYSQYY